MLASLRISLQMFGQKTANCVLKSGQEQSKSLILYAKAMSSSSSMNYDFKTLKVDTPAEYVKHVELNRPEKLNAMNTSFWTDMVECFNKLADDEDCRVVILSAAGKLFTAG
ncbi:hypothetical protein PoB_000882200 [Plakobranchus ocellatus]|uniref:3-hydroxyisobutyryl-coenzyme A hydrolase n=1 Tax=Plakobranchus ocellatus TaxID=259542 RepID=A0AAV3YIW5_9GAST|nr:hypothetical protein PoB_000882200 [Plakobranchus ocellatus]